MQRIPLLPSDVRRKPYSERREALQLLVNAALHSRSICPVSVSMAGFSEPTVGVYRDGRRWGVEVGFHGKSDEADRRLEQIGLEAIEEAVAA